MRPAISFVLIILTSLALAYASEKAAPAEAGLKTEIQGYGELILGSVDSGLSNQSLRAFIENTDVHYLDDYYYKVIGHEYQGQFVFGLLKVIPRYYQGTRVIDRIEIHYCNYYSEPSLSYLTPQDSGFGIQAVTNVSINTLVKVTESYSPYICSGFEVYLTPQDYNPSKMDKIWSVDVLETAKSENYEAALMEMTGLMSSDDTLDEIARGGSFAVSAGWRDEEGESLTFYTSLSRTIVYLSLSYNSDFDEPSYDFDLDKL